MNKRVYSDVSCNSTERDIKRPRSAASSMHDSSACISPSVKPFQSLEGTNSSDESISKKCRIYPLKEINNDIISHVDDYILVDNRPIPLPNHLRNIPDWLKCSHTISHPAGTADDDSLPIHNRSLKALHFERINNKKDRI
eukprot:GHVR01135552.1.p1 GENE.GHVR01135552.1~~GHVR01135552.1.p1  ORF type:complete len:151 (+),score=30.26 GHVR01135552.1:34-453(+)